AQTLGHFGNGQGWQLATKAAHLRVQRIPLIAPSDESLTGLGKERLRTRPHSEPGEAVSFSEQVVRVGDLRDSRGVLKKREQRTDDPAQMTTVARHDSLLGFAERRGSSTTNRARPSSDDSLWTIEWKRCRPTCSESRFGASSFHCKHSIRLSSQ